MADNREIVGWFYRNGKRIPIKAKKSSEKSAMNKAHDVLNHTLGPNELYARVHNVGLDGTVSYSKDVQIGGNPYYDNPDLDTREVETEYGTTKMPLRAGKGKAQLRSNARSKRKDSYGFPQKRELGKKQSNESYVKRIMKERGLSRPDAIKFIKEK